MNRKWLFLHLMFLLGWFFYAPWNVSALERGRPAALNETLSAKGYSPAIMLAQDGDGNYDSPDPVDIHEQYNDRGYAPEVPTPAPGEDQPYGDDGPEMDAPYDDDVPDVEPRAAEEGDLRLTPDDEKPDFDAGPEGSWEGSSPLVDMPDEDIRAEDQDDYEPDTTAPDEYETGGGIAADVDADSFVTQNAKSVNTSRKNIFVLARHALQEEKDSKLKARINCLLNLLEKGADDRVLTPLYIAMYGVGDQVYRNPDDPEVQRLTMNRIMPILSKKFKYAKNNRSRLVALHQAHDTVFTSLNKAIKLDAATSLGGGSAYSKAQKSYVKWVYKKLHSGNSVYAPWSPEYKCDGGFR